MSSAIKLLVVGFIALITNTSAAQSVERPVSDSDRETLLSLPWKLFDQTPNSGWRIYVNQENSEYVIAADLIKAYLARHPDLPPAERAFCRYHGAMMYVYRVVRTGEDPRPAIPNIRQAIVEGKTDGLPADWNYMVRATIAFLAGDRESLFALKQQVAALPNGAAKWPGYPDELLENFGTPYGSWVPGFDKKKK